MGSTKYFKINIERIKEIRIKTAIYKYYLRSCLVYSEEVGGG